jgi:acyl-coenzyme A synthetase/AMP-(fatty) acid ligase
MHDALSAQWQLDLSFGPRSRYLQTLTHGVRAMFDVGSACLRHGGTLVLETRMSAIPAIAAHGITHAILLPFMLQTELSRLPADFPKPRELTIVSFGAAASEGLRKRVMECLATGMGDLYGTVEVGTISAIWDAGGDGFGTVCPEARAEVVDEEDQPLPSGEAGRVRLKSTYMSERYIEDPEMTARMFRGGWFYPGDFAMMRPDGRLKILGRTDDLLNIGGRKIVPAILEASLIDHGVAGDVGLSSLPNADGIEQLCIAIADFGRDDKEIMERIMTALRNIRVGQVRVFKLDRIPRSDNGKLQRDRLKEEISRQLGLR